MSEQPEPQTIVNEKDGTVLMRIPAGPFVMGDDKREVYVEEFWIGKYPATVAQYRRFCRTCNRRMPGEPHWGWEDQHPVVRVTWTEAEMYCRWAGLRLPTEHEWEKAARGTDGREYPWGDGEPTEELCNFDENVRRPTEVGNYPAGASPYGCLDMAGNVWEWCDEEGTSSVLRGGSCWDDSACVRCAHRLAASPHFWSLLNGFRCALRSAR